MRPRLRTSSVWLVSALTFFLASCDPSPDDPTGDSGGCGNACTDGSAANDTAQSNPQPDVASDTRDGGPADNRIDAVSSDATPEATTSDAVSVDAAGEASDGAFPIEAAPEASDGAVSIDASLDASDGSNDQGDATQPDASTSPDDATVVLSALCAAPPCGTGQVFCGGRCVASDDPAYGCGSGTCTPCQIARGYPKCSGAACAIAACQPGWADCNHNPTDGCEADLSNPATCTSCDTKCANPTPLCSPTGCVAACTPPLTTCNDRCVNLASDAMHCGGCSTDCAQDLSWMFASAAEFNVCTNGQCGCSATACGNGRRCIDTARNTNGCGSCSQTCSSPPNGTAACEASQCVQSCEPGWALCGGRCVVNQTDPAHCGACGHACAQGDICAGGHCAPKSSLWLVTGLTTPEDIAVDASNVYFSEPGNGTIKAVPKAGGAIIPLAQGQPQPRHIALDDTYVYWINSLGGAIMRAPKNGAAAPEVVLAATGGGLAVDATYVYFANGFEIRRASKAPGSTSTVLATFGRTAEMVFDGSKLFVLGTEVNGIGTHVYSVESGTGAITWLRQVHGADTLRVDAQRLAWRETISVVWMDKNNRLVFQGVNSPVPASSPALSPCGVAWVGSSMLNLTRFGSTNGMPLVPITWGSAFRSVIDDDVVYWTDQSGAIGRFRF